MLAAGRSEASRVGACTGAASEETLHRAVAEHLARRARPGVWWCHIPNGGARSRGEAGRLKAMGTRAGAPDLLVVIEGKALFLELKAQRGRVSPAQVEAHAGLRAAGAEVAVAWGLDEALGWLVRAGALR